MPTLKPKALGYYPQHFNAALMQALAKQDVWWVVEEGLTEKEAKLLHRKLTAMRSGLKTLAPAGELRDAALADRIRISNPATQWGVLRTVSIMVKSRLLSPSEVTAKALEDFHSGRVSSPF